MGCVLNKFKTYNVGQVRHDRGNGSYTVQLTDQVQKCPDGTFSSKKAKLVVQAGAPPSLSFDTVANRPVITVPNEGFVLQYGEAGGISFGGFVLLVVGLGLVAWFLRTILKGGERNTTVAYEPSYSGVAASVNAPSTPGTAYSPPPASSGPSHVIVNNNSGGSDGFLTGALVGSMLASSHSDHTTVIHDREVVHDSDSNNSSSSFESDSSDSYSSDTNSNSSSDSYSSDSDDRNSSYESDSSDSSSDYSSDSSSSSDYSSDSSSGGSDFSSDN